MSTDFSVDHKLLSFLHVLALFRNRTKGIKRVILTAHGYIAHGGACTEGLHSGASFMLFLYQYADHRLL